MPPRKTNPNYFLGICFSLTALNVMDRQLLAIALNTFLESVRQPIFFVLLIAGGLMQGLTIADGTTFGMEDVTYANDSSPANTAASADLPDPFGPTTPIFAPG